VRNPQYAGHASGCWCYFAAAGNIPVNNDCDTAPARAFRFIETAGKGL